MGRVLSDENAAFKEIREDYYASAFGKYKDFARHFYEEVERTVSFKYMKEETDAASALPGFKEAKIFLTETLKNFPDVSDLLPVQAESMEILRFAADNILKLIDVLILKIEGKPEEEIAAADARKKGIFQSQGTPLSALCGRLFRQYDHRRHRSQRKERHLYGKRERTLGKNRGTGKE